MKYDVIVVGGGIAGLTAAAYLSKAGYSTLLCEKENTCGGLVTSFERDGFVYDGGIRAMENSGVLFPMLKQLGLEIGFVKNHISLGIEDRIIRVESEENIRDYRNLLVDLYPESEEEIDEIVVQIKRIMHYMDVQYGIDNPAFLDMKADRDYMLRKILPWMFKYALTFRKISALNEPVVDFLKRFSQNRPLLDIITQHFFRETPAFFALSYIKLYLDYHYPLGGTGKVIEKLVAFIEEHGGIIRTGTEVSVVDPEENYVVDTQGDTHQYGRLIWAADQKALYWLVDVSKIKGRRVREAVLTRREMLADKVGNDSVFTLYLGVNLDREHFAGIHSEHFFYTPRRDGETKAGPLPLGASKDAMMQWLEKFFALTTYEITCPVMRDESLAPKGQAGLIVSLLFDYQLTKSIQEMGWYEEFKSFAETCILDTLEASIYPGIKDAIVHKFSSSPLTMERYTANTDGAITGWSFTNRPMPAEHRLPKIFSATDTPIPDVFQAGQWTYSPSGLPISILTGKLAADRVIKGLSKNR